MRIRFLLGLMLCGGGIAAEQTVAEMQATVRKAQEVVRIGQTMREEHETLSFWTSVSKNRNAKLLEIVAAIEAKTKAEAAAFGAGNNTQQLREDLSALQHQACEIIRYVGHDGEPLKESQKNFDFQRNAYQVARAALKTVPTDLAAELRQYDAIANGNENAVPTKDEIAKTKKTPPWRDGEALDEAAAKKKAADEERRKLLEQTKDSK